MAFTGNYMCTRFKSDLLRGINNFSADRGDTFKLAMYTDAATLNADSLSYLRAEDRFGEISGAGYTRGGGTLVNADVYDTGTTAFTDFNNITFSNSTITARGALIYNDTDGAKPSVVVLDFGSDKTSTSGDFRIIFPAANDSNAIIRIS